MSIIIRKNFTFRLLVSIIMIMLLSGCASLFDDDDTFYNHKDFVAIRSINGPVETYIEEPDGEYTFMIDPTTGEDYILNSGGSEIKALNLQGEYYRTLVPDMYNVVATSPNRLHFVVQELSTLYLFNSDGSGMITIDDTDFTKNNACFSADSNYIFYWRRIIEGIYNTYELMRYDIEAQETEYIYANDDIDYTNQDINACAIDNKYFYSISSNFYYVYVETGTRGYVSSKQIIDMTVNWELMKVYAIENYGSQYHLTVYDITNREFEMQPFSGLYGSITLNYDQTKLLVQSANDNENYLINIADFSDVTIKGKVSNASFSADGTRILGIVSRAMKDD